MTPILAKYDVNHIHEMCSISGIHVEKLLHCVRCLPRGLAVLVHSIRVEALQDPILLEADLQGLQYYLRSTKEQPKEVAMTPRRTR